MIVRVIIFLLLNFGALAIGGLFTGKGVPSDWYATLNKAPWTPPGWAFGFAWTTIMICFSLYMAYLWPAIENKTMVIGLYAVQWILNVSWNPVFFYLHKTNAALIVIVLLTAVVGYFLFYYWPVLKVKSALILPYFIWLLIATSLNGYVSLNN
jgi:tryptophan-rich sensory protein